MGPDRPGMDKALGLIDGCPVGQRNDHAHARRGHQPPTNGIMPNCVEQHFVEDGVLLRKRRACCEHWPQHCR